jgi:hypothetical protein
MKNRKNIFFKMARGFLKNINVRRYRRIAKIVRKYQLLSKIRKWDIVGDRAIQIARTTLLIQKKKTYRLA